MIFVLFLLITIVLLFGISYLIFSFIKSNIFHVEKFYVRKPPRGKIHQKE